MMRPGIALRDDADFDYALQFKQEVEVLLDGEVDYRGTLVSYSRDLLQVIGGDRYLRRLVEVKTV
ncbi:MAG: hypothetical protein K0R57_3436 [Paenibacillaceae bacterium]|jgi:hypothetical protein|nr:hypothetical protein [Paenibacillaceae bacterium]